MITTREYQNHIINKTIYHFIDNDKALLNMCCGSGKTITSLLIAQQMKVKKLLILVPTIILLDQWIKSIKIILIIITQNLKCTFLFETEMSLMILAYFDYKAH